MGTKNEGFHRRSKGGDFRKSEIWEIKDFKLGRLPTHAITLQEVGILPTLVYSSLFGQKNGCFEFQIDVLHLGERMYLL